jgi:alanine racemase
MHHPLRLTIDSTAIKENWRWLQDRAGVPAGAAVKADGYGLGARETVRTLYDAGCRDFFVSTWAEAEALGPLPLGRLRSVNVGTVRNSFALILDCGGCNPSVVS